MKILMLRGQVPQDRDPQEIVFDHLYECDDMWTQLVASMTYPEDFTELWYWGGTRKKKFRDNFIERWVPDFATYKSNFIPDVIFCRGGFPEYHTVLKRFSKAIKIYYGAGRRFLPQPEFTNYDIILQDSPEQLEISQNKFPKSLSTLYIKPAAENIFYPIETKKEFDVCFPANAAQPFKGHKFIYSTVPEHIKLLNLGNKPNRYSHSSNVTSYRVLRSDMAKHISKCKVGIVAAEGIIDSCPRVIAEMLACDIPIVVLDSVRFWKDKYIESSCLSRQKNSTGECTNSQNFWSMVEFVLSNLNLYNPRKYYDEHLNLFKAAEFLRSKINENSI